jgi:hypothetical protein
MTPEQKEAYIKEKKYVKELHSLQKQGKRRCRICKTVKILDCIIIKKVTVIIAI